MIRQIMCLVEERFAIYFLNSQTNDLHLSDKKKGWKKSLKEGLEPYVETRISWNITKLV